MWLLLVGGALVVVGTLAVTKPSFADAIVSYNQRETRRRGVWAGDGVETRSQARIAGVVVIVVGLAFVAGGLSLFSS
jgi:uncharacterized membrane protein HdeD (DUF308 family)